MNIVNLLWCLSELVAAGNSLGHFLTDEQQPADLSLHVYKHIMHFLIHALPIKWFFPFNICGDGEAAHSSQLMCSGACRRVHCCCSNVLHLRQWQLLPKMGHWFFFYLNEKRPLCLCFSMDVGLPSSVSVQSCDKINTHWPSPHKQQSGFGNYERLLYSRESRNYFNFNIFSS